MHLFYDLNRAEKVNEIEEFWSKCIKNKFLNTKKVDHISCYPNSEFLKQGNFLVSLRKAKNMELEEILNYINGMAELSGIDKLQLRDMA